MPDIKSSPHCELVLSKPPTCGDTSKVRSYAMCLAWKIMSDERAPRLQLRRAWQKIRETCPAKR